MSIGKDDVNSRCQIKEVELILCSFRISFVWLYFEFWSRIFISIVLYYSWFYELLISLLVVGCNKKWDEDVDLMIRIEREMLSFRGRLHQLSYCSVQNCPCWEGVSVKRESHLLMSSFLWEKFEMKSLVNEFFFVREVRVKSLVPPSMSWYGGSILYVEAWWKCIILRDKFEVKALEPPFALSHGGNAFFSVRSLRWNPFDHPLLRGMVEMHTSLGEVWSESPWTTLCE